MTKFVILENYDDPLEHGLELVVFEKEIDEKKLLEEYDKFWDSDLYPDGWEWDDLMDLLDKFGKHKMYSIAKGDLPTLRY